MSDPWDAAPFRPLWLAELFALALPEAEYLVDGLLPVGAAALLSAREKAGKGLLTIDLCACVALEEPFLGRAVRGGPAVYCAAEEHLRDVRDRIAARLGDRRDAPLAVLPLDGSTDDRLRLDDVESIQRLLAMVAEVEPALVVLDTLRELHDRTEDSSDEMGPLLRPVRQVAHQTNTTIVVNHHQNKQGGFRGSTAIRAAFDLEWSFARTDGDDAAGPPAGTLRVEGRHGPRQTLPVTLGPGLRWQIGQASPPPDATVRARLLAHLAATDAWRTARELAAALDVPFRTVQTALSALMQEQPCPLDVAGTGAKNDPRRYHARTPGLPGLAPPAPGGLMIAAPPTPRERVGNHQDGTAETAGDDRWTRRAPRLDAMAGGGRRHPQRR